MPWDYYCETWTNFWLRALIKFLYEPFIVDRQFRSDFDEIFNLSFKVVATFFFLILVVLGIFLILIQLWAISRTFLPIRTFTRAVQRRFLSDLSTRILPLYSQAYTQNTFLNQAIIIRKYISMHSGSTHFN